MALVSDRSKWKTRWKRAMTDHKDRLCICQYPCIPYGDDIRQDCEQSCGVLGGDRRVTLAGYLPPEKKKEMQSLSMYTKHAGISAKL